MRFLGSSALRYVLIRERVPGASAGPAECIRGSSVKGSADLVAQEFKRSFPRVSALVIECIAVSTLNIFLDVGDCLAGKAMTPHADFYASLVAPNDVLCEKCHLAISFEENASVVQPLHNALPRFQIYCCDHLGICRQSHSPCVVGLLVTGFPPTSCAGLLLGAEPSFSVLGRNLRGLIIMLTRNVIDAFARVDADVALDVARRADRRCNWGSPSLG